MIAPEIEQKIEAIRLKIKPLREDIIHHKVYSAIKNLDDLKVFMSYHVYAVWDFMSLLKTLQNNLTCTTIPWFPKGNPDTRFLINEIVVGEESDIDMNGVRKSHFELYLEAMHQLGASTGKLEDFLSALQDSGDLMTSLKLANVPSAAQDFVNFTFKVIHSNQAYLQAAIFTFGREDLIPGMFVSIVKDMNEKFPDSISIFKYYLDRHIEVDGDHHSHLALQMTANLCGSDAQKWEQVEAVVIASLEKRKLLWDGVLEEIENNIILP